MAGRGQNHAKVASPNGVISAASKISLTRHSSLVNAFDNAELFT